MTTDEAKLCEACGERRAGCVLSGHLGGADYDDMVGAFACWGCRALDASDAGYLALYERIRDRRRSRPGAELEALEFAANPLRHLAEAFRSLTDAKFCVDCGRTCAAWRMHDEKRCCYCGLRARRAKLPEKWRPAEQGLGLDSRIASATPKEAERREVWDWDCWSTPGAES